MLWVLIHYSEQEKSSPAFMSNGSSRYIDLGLKILLGRFLLHVGRKTSNRWRLLLPQEREIIPSLTGAREEGCVCVVARGQGSVSEAVILSLGL